MINMGQINPGDNAIFGAHDKTLALPYACHRYHISRRSSGVARNLRQVVFFNSGHRYPWLRSRREENRLKNLRILPTGGAYEDRCILLPYRKG